MGILLIYCTEGEACQNNCLGYLLRFTGLNPLRDRLQLQRDSHGPDSMRAYCTILYCESQVPDGLMALAEEFDADLGAFTGPYLRLSHRGREILEEAGLGD